MTTVPAPEVLAEVFGAIGHALELNIIEAHRRYGALAIADIDLFPDVIAAVKWAVSADRPRALALVQDALTNAAAVDDGPTLARAALALSFGLTQPVGTSGPWTTQETDRLINAAMVTSWRPGTTTPEIDQ
ncbi:hypothetical protein ACFWA1_36005 [Streptomyces sp. NPDC060005]|uniref:hypothetical protein n=1 Tax=Streptomyces sp. NPDC060005 TaxID=3347034 RepID=UPI0036962C40